MATWTKQKLGELIAIKHGFAFLGKYFSDAGSHVVLTPGNFHDKGGFRRRAEKDKWYTGPVPNDYVLKKDDLIVAMTEQGEGLLGSSALIPVSNLYLHNQRLGLVDVLDKKKTDPHFLYYLFNLPSVRKKIRGSASGTKVRHTSPNRIYEISVAIPDSVSQTRIASVLSAYDDLFENNENRIKVLEEMARLLYTEWFVKFKFPGHGSELKVPPKGWKIEKIGDCIEILGGGTPSRKIPKYWGGKINWYTPTDLTKSDMFFSESSSEKISEKGLANSSAKLFPAYSILLTSRATIGAISINTKQSATNQGFITCLPNIRVPLYYLYHWLKSHVSMFEELGSGATFKEISKGTFKKIKILLPDSDVLFLFERKIEAIAEMLLQLQRSDKVLRETRELLLPKLMSGVTETK